MTLKNSASALTGSACLQKANVLLLALKPVGPDLILLLALEVLLWTA